MGVGGRKLPLAAIVGQPQHQPGNVRFGKPFNGVLNFGDGAHGPKEWGQRGLFQGSVPAGQEAREPGLGTVWGLGACDFRRVAEVEGAGEFWGYFGRRDGQHGAGRVAVREEAREAAALGFEGVGLRVLRPVVAGWRGVEAHRAEDIG